MTTVSLPAPALVAAAARAAEAAAWNRTHSMGGMRQRGGMVVTAIEERRRRLVARTVLRSRPERVVDVGCEDGWVAEAYAPHVTEAVLVDVDPAMLAAAEAKRIANARTLVADAAGQVPLPEGSADVLLLCAILEHLSDPAAALSAWARVVRPGGRVVAYVPADGPILFAKRVLRATRLGGLVRGLSLEPAPGHVQRFDRRSFTALLARVGRVEEVRFDPICLGYLGSVGVA